VIYFWDQKLLGLNAAILCRCVAVLITFCTLHLNDKRIAKMLTISNTLWTRMLVDAKRVGRLAQYRWCTGALYWTFNSWSNRERNVALAACHSAHCCKIALMTYSCVHGTSPTYFHGICRPVASVEGRTMLRSAKYGELVEPRTRGKRYGPRSFRVAAAFVWNNLPRHLRNDDITREQFTRDLKTFLFARDYSSEAPLRTSV